MINRFAKRLLAIVLGCALMATSAIPVYADGGEDAIQKEKEDTIKNLSMTDKQKSAIAMLNYLRVMSHEITESSNSRIYLDNVYSSIINNTNPNAVDSNSKSEIKELLDRIFEYQSIATKRERLQYIYQQNQAKALQKAIPNPVSVLNVVQSGSPAKALISVVYMAVDAKSSYDSYMSDIDEKYMQDGWVLDDAAAANLHECRSDAFDYMVEMCTDNDLDGKLALNENAIKEFVKWENHSNLTRKIKFFEDNQTTYSAYGKYWLVRAESYYENKQYDKCLEAIDKYEKMNIVTFRKDHDFAKTLVVGLAAVGEDPKKKKDYVKISEHYLDLLLANIEIGDWALRYVAAESYMDLSMKTKDDSKKKFYLQKAYDLVEENVNYLIDEQYAKNDAYMADVVKQTPKKTDTGAVKKEIKTYNKWIEEERKKELPPVYEPLVVNCELLFGLADKLNLSDKDKKDVNNMLHSEDKPLFLVSQLENKFWFNASKSIQKPNIEFDGKEINIPANLLSQGTTIKATITSGSDTESYAEWVLTEVKRGKESSVDKFVAHYDNKLIKKYDYKDGDRVKIDIIPTENSAYDKLSYTFDVSVTKKLKLWSDTQFVME